MKPKDAPEYSMTHLADALSDIRDKLEDAERLLDKDDTQDAIAAALRDIRDMALIGIHGHENETQRVKDGEITRLRARLAELRASKKGSPAE